MRTRKKAAPTERISPEDVLKVLDWSDDYDLFARECVSFKGKEGVAFLHDKPHPGQLKLREIQQHKLRKVLWVVLKARQVGSSSEIASQLVELALFNPGSSIAVAAQTDKGAKSMSALYSFVVKHLPRPLRIGMFKADIQVYRIYWPKLGSEIVFGTANSDSFRGVPRQAAHITEAAFVSDLQKTLEVLRPTVHGPLILESTANGPGDFHMIWNDPHVMHTFIGWKEDATCVSDEPLPKDLTAKEIEYIERNDLSLQQASWFVQNLRQSNWESFMQEHPIVAEEAFRLTGDRYFRQAFLSTLPEPTGPLHIHTKPIPGHKYVLGADPASGSLSGDRSAFVLLDVTDIERITTAVTYAHRIPPTEFAKVIAQYSKLYNGAVVVVERNAGWGLSVLDTLRSLSVRMYMGKTWDKLTKQFTEQLGWNTTSTTRPLMLAAMQDMVGRGVWVVNDPRLEAECNGFRYNDKGKPCAVGGCHDDMVMGGALALQGITQARSTAPMAKMPRLPDSPTFEQVAQYEMATGMLAEEDDDN